MKKTTKTEMMASLSEEYATIKRSYAERDGKVRDTEARRDMRILRAIHTVIARLPATTIKMLQGPQ
jgi:hypothetical protein